MSAGGGATLPAMDRWRARLPGIGLALAAGLAGLALARAPALARLQLSPLTLAIVFGMLVGNLAGARLPPTLAPGIGYAQQALLRAGVVLYGLRISLQQVLAVGPRVLLLDLVVVTVILVLGLWIGCRWLGLDRDSALLTACGSAICGAAAVLAMERVLDAQPGKVAMATATVVLFGTASLFLYPWLYPWSGFDAATFGIYAGATVHEVAQVVAIGESVGPEAAELAVIVKLARVLLLVPLLLAVGIWKARSGGVRSTVVVPRFVLAFLLVVMLNTVLAFPEPVRQALHQLDVLLLATAMAALGLETRWDRLKALGVRPLLLAAILFAVLVAGGQVLVRLLVAG